MRWLDYNTDSMDVNFSKLWEIMKETGGLQPVVSQTASMT